MSDQNFNHRKQARNQEIYRRFKDAEIATLLAKEYGVTRTRLYQIIAMVERQNAAAHLRRRRS